MAPGADTRLHLAPQVVSHTLEDTVALLNVDTGLYYTVDGPGIILVESCGSGKSLRQITEQVCGEYEVEEEEALADLIELAEDLLAEGLVTVDEA